MSTDRLLTILAVGVVAIAIVAGLVVTGTPQRQRQLRQDEQRMTDLGRLSTTLARRYMETGQLPDELEALVDGRTLTSLPRDPASNEAYEYLITGPAAFSLCAEFSHAADARSARDFFAHDAGRACFEFDYSTLRLD